MVTDAVWPSRLSTVPPSPWNTWTISKLSWLRSAGDRASNSGLKPLKSTVRSRAGLVFSIGIVASSASTFWLPTSWVRAT